MGRHPARLRSMAPIAAAGGAWETAYSATLNSDSGSWRDDCGRQVVNLSTAGTKVRVTFEASSGDTLAVDNASIVLRSGSTANGTTTPTELLFSSGSGFDIASSNTIISDELVYSPSASTDYLISMDATKSGTETRLGSTGTYYFATSSNCHNVQNMPAGYSTETGSFIKLIEVWVPA